MIFAYHGYPWLIHRLTYRRTNHDNIHVRGYKEEGTTTTPFDMVMLNDLDRFHLVMDVIDRVPGLGARAAHAAPADGRRAAARTARTPASTARTCPRCDWTGRRAGTRSGARAPAVRVLVVNAGSSSLKLRLLDATTRSLAPARPSSAGRTRRLGRRWRRARPAAARPTRSGTASCTAASGSPAPVRVDDAVIADLDALADLAPLHQPRSLAAHRRRRGALLPDVPAVACFDTAFHATLPAAAAHLRAAARSGASARRCAATASTGCPTPTPSRRAAELLGRPVDDCGS